MRGMLTRRYHPSWPWLIVIGAVIGVALVPLGAVISYYLPT